MTQKRNIEDLRIIVLGGLVMDCFVTVDRLPQWHEAVQAKQMRFVPGGKGLNQAVAAARLGAQTSVIGAVGSDPFGISVVDSLKADNVQTRAGLKVIADVQTPVTLVFVGPGGMTSFVGWKNQEKVIVDRDAVLQAETVIRDADAILISFEISTEAVATAIALARKYDVKVFVNPAPPIEPPNVVADVPLDQVDYLIPNEWEARRLRHYDADVVSTESLEDVATALGSELGIGFVCITRAHEPCVVWSNGDIQLHNSFRMKSEDTTGGSDAFCAALAVFLCAGESEATAVKMAHAAGSLAVMRPGGAESMPTKKSLDSHLRWLRTREPRRGR